MDQSLDLRFYIGVLWRRLYVMLAVFGLFSAAAFAVAVLWPPTYQSRAKFIVEAQQIPSDMVRSTITSYADERLQVIEQKITSRDVVLKLANKLNLYPEKRRTLTPTELYDLVRESINIERLDLSLIDRRRRDNAFTLAFTASFEHRSPNTASEVANELVTLILNENVKSRTTQTAETTRFIQGETDKRREELVKIEAQISQFKLENDQALPEKLQFQMARLERAKSDLGNFDKEIQASEEQERLLQFELNVRTTTVNTVDKSAPAAQSVAMQIEALETELARKQSVYTDSHPDIRVLKEQIAALRTQEESRQLPAENKTDAEAAGPSNLDLDAKLIMEKIEAIKQRRAFLTEQRANVASSVEALNQIIVKVPEVQSLLGNLERQRDIIQKQLDDLTAKLNEARLGEKLEANQQGERFEVIEQPIVPTEPIKPKRPLILLGGIGAAGGAALGLVMILELINRTVHTGADILRALGQPPLGTIPYFTTEAERRRSRIRILVISLATVTVIVAALAAIHILYMPFDVVFYKILNRFQL